MENYKTDLGFHTATLGEYSDCGSAIGRESHQKLVVDTAGWHQGDLAAEMQSVVAWCVEDRNSSAAAERGYYLTVLGKSHFLLRRYNAA